MGDSVIVALIGLAGSGIGSLIGVMASSKLTQYRIEQLEKRVSAHNNLVERTYKLEKRADVTDEKFRITYHRIQDLERKDSHDEYRSDPHL